MNDFELDLESIISQIKPNIVTPSLTKVTSVSNDKKPRVIADIIVRSLHSTLDNPVTKDIIHDGQIHKIKFFDIEPLMNGVWSMVSLMLLQLSYGEQSTIIESIYPKNIQLTAKAFAINFTKDVEYTNIKIENDTEMVDKLDSANAGIAMILAMLTSQGYITPHPDKIRNEMSEMTSLVEATREAESFKQASDKAQQAAKYND